MARRRFFGQVSPAGPQGLGHYLWTVTRKREVALRLLRGEPAELLSRQLGVELFRLEQWREKAIAGIDASLKERKGDPVKAELDIAMADRGVDHAGGTAGGQDGDVRPFGAAEVAAMSAATSPGTGLDYGLQRVCAAWGFARSSFYAMGSRPPLSAHQQSAGDRSPRSRTRLCWWPSRPTVEASNPGRARDTSQGLGSASGLSWHPCFPQAGALRVMRENNLLSPQRCRRIVAEIPMSVRSSPMPPTSCGLVHGRRSGVHGGRRLGLDIHRHRALETPSASAGMCASEATASHHRLRADIPHRARKQRRCMPRPNSAGVAFATWRPRLHQVSVGTMHRARIKFWGIQPVLSLKSPRPTASPRGSSARLEGTRSSMAA